MRYKLIMNPNADHGHVGINKTPLHDRVEAIGQGHELVWAYTERPRHATEYAASAAAEGFDVVVAMGGDGTVHEVVNGLMSIPAEQRPRIAIVPVGSGNDFAWNVGIPHQVDEAIRTVFSGRPRQTDACYVTDGSGRGEYWNNSLGIGFSGAVNLATRQMTKLRGFLMYLVAVVNAIVLNPQRLQAQIQLDEQAPFPEGVTMVSICNGPREGGGFPVAPNALVDDGRLTYMVMRALSQAQMFFFLPIVMGARHLAWKRWFYDGTAERIQVSTDKNMAIHIDGEIFADFDSGVRQIEAHIIPGALQVIVPG